MNPIRGAIFDLDGTVADTFPLIIHTFRMALAPHIGRALSSDEIVAGFGPSEEGMIAALVPANPEPVIDDYIRLYTEHHRMCPEPFHGMKDLLVELKNCGVRLGLVTGKGRRSAAASLDHFGLADLFSDVETGAPTGSVKPEAIRNITARWSIPLQEIVYVGDIPSDMRAAREAGVLAVGAAWAECCDRDSLAAESPDALCRSVDELRTFLLG